MLGQKNNTHEIIESTLASRKKFVRALFERPDSFAKILPYEEYLTEAGMFVLKDGSVTHPIFIFALQLAITWEGGVDADVYSTPGGNTV